MDKLRLDMGIGIMRQIQDDNQKSRMNNRSNLFSNVPAIYDIPYLQDDKAEHRLDVYGETDQPLPVIIEIHGWGWISCDKSYNELHGKYLASQGFIVCNINYTLQPEGNFNQQIQDIFHAIEWVYNNGETYGFDTEHIYLTGDSAGGHLVLLTGAVLGSNELQKYFGVKSGNWKIKKIAVSCSAFDCWKLYNSTDKMSELAKAALFGTRKVDEEYINNVSIDKLLDKCSFPELFLITSPTDDLLYSETKRLQAIFKENQIKHTFKEYIGTENKLDHVFNVHFPEYKESMDANLDIIKFFLTKDE